MTNLSRMSAIALLAFPLIACGPAEDPTGVIPQGHLDAMDKAKDVENVLQDAQKKQMEGIDKDE
ncbi:MAG: hypothetical protein IMF06_07715 [Proteobacteria bacterium]|nr:hypothetical protein [Pseudomonadota bacterium]